MDGARHIRSEDSDLKIFISYVREDTGFADELAAALDVAGHTVFIDRRSIVAGEDWKARLGGLIHASDTLVLVASPDVESSDICAWEIAEAMRQSKRILPVVTRPTQFEGQTLSKLKHLNAISFADGHGISALAKLLIGLTGNTDWLREHTRLYERAAEWDANKRSDEQLLRGDALAKANLWLAHPPSSELLVTELQKAFITESEKAEADRNKKELLQIQAITTAQRDREKALTDAEEAQRIKSLHQRRAGRLLVGLGIMAFLMVTYALYSEYQTSIREANVFASQAAAAFDKGQCQRAIRFAIAGLPALKGDLGLAPASEELLDDLSDYPASGGCNRLIRSFREEGISGAAFSPDGKTILTSSNKVNSGAKVWDVATGRLVSSFSEQPTGVSRARFSSDGSLILTLSWPDTIRVWNANTRLMNFAIAIPNERFDDAIFNKTGTRILATTFGVENASAYLWNARDGAPVARFVVPGGVSNAIFSPDGSTIALTSFDGLVRGFDSLTGGKLFDLGAQAVDVFLFSPDSRRVATVFRGDNRNRQAIVWDTKGRQTATLGMHRDQINSLTFSPDSRTLVTTSKDDTAIIWDIDAHRARLTLRHESESAFLSDNSGVRKAVFRPDGQRLVTISGTRIYLWHARSGAKISSTSNISPFVNCKFNADGARIACGTGGYGQIDRVLIYESSNLHLITEFSAAIHGDSDELFDPAGAHILTTSTEGSARLWNISDHSAETILEADGSAANSATFDNHDDRVAAAYDSGLVRIWNTKSWKVTVDLKGHSGPVRTVVFSADDLRLLSGGNDRTARIWDAGTGKELVVLGGHAGSITTAVFDPTRPRVLTASEDNLLRVWNAATGSLLASLDRHRGPVRQISFSRDGRRFVTASDDGTAWVWDSDTLSPVKKLAPELLSGWSTVAAVFSLDGTRVWSVGIGQAMEGYSIWDIDSGKSIDGLFGDMFGGPFVTYSSDVKRMLTFGPGDPGAVWIVHAKNWTKFERLIVNDAAVNSAQFSSSGNHIVIGASDGTVQVWRIDPILMLPRIFRQRYVCEERLKGDEAFTDQEMEDPLLRGRADLRNPCERRGPLSPERWLRVSTELWAWLQGGLLNRSRDSRN
jgi:WD40 repeat protein